MKSMCIIIPYYGKFPNYFDLWLESVKYNPTVNFLIVTDIQLKYDYPQNVHIKNISFEDLKKRVQSLYDFKISLKNPYRLCDYKVAYGHIFYDEIKEYDFWGYCDIDLIFGNIRSFITDDILEEYDKINLHGHFSLHRNCDAMRYLYTAESKDIIYYKKAFAIDWVWHFDEYPGVSYLCQEKNIKYVDVEEYADLDWSRNKFIKVYDHSEKKTDSDDIQQVFFWKEGELVNIIKQGEDIITRDMFYVHLQKRKMKNNVSSLLEGYYIVPNEFLNQEYKNIVKKLEKYEGDKETEAWKKFKKECFTNRFKINYWKYKLYMAKRRK